jgi:isoquinoline 1-oxidoreductase alpha subunit
MNVAIVTVNAISHGLCLGFHSACVFSMASLSCVAVLKRTLLWLEFSRADFPLDCFNYYGQPDFDILKESRNLREGFMIRLKVNGAAKQYSGDPDMPLLWFLRDELQLTGSKFGCGMGLCGACTVHVNGEPARSCLTPMKSVLDKTVTTIEGLSAHADHPLQEAWKQVNVPQCGYCQTGQIMQAAALLKQKPKPTDHDIDEAMQGNICRCGTYQRIRQAIKIAAGVEQGAKA